MESLDPALFERVLSFIMLPASSLIEDVLGLWVVPIYANRFALCRLRRALEEHQRAVAVCLDDDAVAPEGLLGTKDPRTRM